MNARDFELIAYTLKSQQPEYAEYTRYEGWAETVRAFANALRATNKQFNRDKFIRACGETP